MMDKLRKVASAFSSQTVLDYTRFQQDLDMRRRRFAEQRDMMDVFNQIASLSDSGYALAIKNTIEQICFCRSSPNYETFMSMSKLAIEALKSGVSQSDVLEYFDTILYMESGEKRP